jgi:DMSO/TMAO reductase YedYZ molybdopterin-dependent catalytic subunit
MRSRNLLIAAAALALSLGAAAAEKHDHSHDGDKYASKTLTVSGWVENSLVLDVDALRAMPATEFGESPMRCSRPEPKYVVESYRGVLLRHILEAAGVVDDDVRHSRNYMYVVANATDDYKVVFSLHEIRNTPVGDEILVFYEKNGEPLGTREGLIALVSLADANRCNRHIRWLNSIEVRRHGAAAP